MLQGSTLTGLRNACVGYIRRCQPRFRCEGGSAFDIVAPSLVLCVNQPSDPFLRTAIVRPLPTGVLTVMSTPSTAAAPRTHYGAIAIVGALFFVFGFVTWLNGPLIQFAKLASDVSDSLAFLIPFAFYISYFCLALPSSSILRMAGMKKGMALGLFAMAMGAVVFGQYTTGACTPAR